MPRHRILVLRLQKPLILALFWAFSIPLCLSQTAGRVDNVQPGNVLALVSGVLQAHYHGLQKVESGTNDLISNYDEFRAHLLPYRAHFRFHLDGNSLFVTMEDLESPGNGTWNRSLIPAEAKLIAQMVDQLNAANQQLAKSSANPVPAPSPEPLPTPPAPPLDQAKSLVFDPTPSVCAEGMCAIRKDGLWGFIDYRGNMVLDFRYHSAVPPYFSHGVCVVRAADSANREIEGEVYIDKKGNVLFGRKVFKSASPFDEEVTFVSLFEKPLGYNSAVLDLQGRILTSISPTLIFGNWPAYQNEFAGGFRDGLVNAYDTRRGENVGFLNAKMQWIVEPIYRSVQAFSEGIAWVQTNPQGGEPKWGAINTKGKVVISFAFSKMPEPFSEGLAIITCSDNKKGFADITGKLVIPCRYVAANHFVHGHAFVRGPENVALLIDKQGNAVARFREDGAGLSLSKLRADGLYVFTTRTSGGALSTGLMDGDWKIAVQPFDGEIGLFPVDGDPAGLAWATDSDQGGNHQGFVNRRGEFVLLQQRSLF